MQNKLTNYVYLTELVLNFILLLILVFTPNYETEYCLEWGVLIVISIICLIISNRYRTNSFWVHILGYMAISGCICYMYYSHPELRIYLAILVVIYLVKYVLILSKKYTLIVYLFFIFQFINFYRISYHSQNLVDGNEVTLYYYIVFILTGTIAEIIALCWKDSVIKTKYGVDASQSKNILPNIDILNSNNGLDTRVVKTITTASNDGLLGIQKKVQSKRNEIVDINLSIGTWLKDFEKNILNKYKTIDFIPLPKNKFIYADVNSLSRVIRSLLEISDTKLYGKIIKLQIDIYKKPNEQNYLIISILSNKSKNKVQNLYSSINIKNKTLDNKISDCKQLVQAINGVL